MTEKETMFLCIEALNTLAIAIIIGKIKQVENRKKNTLYDLAYQALSAMVGISMGTILAYLIKWG